MTSKHIRAMSGHPLDVCKCGSYRCDHGDQPKKKKRGNDGGPCKHFVMIKAGGKLPEPVHG